MTRYHLVPLLASPLLALSSASAQTLIYWDNFNTGLGQLALDSAPLDGRRSGTEPTLLIRSSQRQQVSIADQLYMWGSGGRIRFQADTANWANWAALPGGSSPAILGAHGLTVDFDIRYTFNTDPNSFIGFAAGFKGATAGEPLVRITDAETDHAIRIGKDGTYTRYKNGVQSGDAVSGSTALGRHVKIEYVFDSFADGSPVIAKTTVAGQVVGYDTFTWNGNAGELYLEMENRGSDTYFDDMKISTTVVSKIDLAGDPDVFRTGAPSGRVVGDLTTETLLNESGMEDSTYTLVTGTGDTDNSKFTINSASQLVTGAYDFKQGAAGKTYSVRIRSTGKTSGAVTEQVFTVTPVKDDDNDMLPDPWELQYAHNLTDLSGLVFGPGPGAGTGDYDGDGKSDLDEYFDSLVTPGYSPVSLDSDGDGILDSEEETPTDPNHVVTSAVLADTDGDGIADNAEYTGGTSPINADTDGDGFRDGFELSHGSNPLLATSRPALPAGFSLVQLTDDASSGISTTKTYTHKVSGGAAATINGVTFDALTNTVTPANFAWTLNAGVTKNAMTGANLNGWSPANGGVTGTGLVDLLDNFTYASANTDVVQNFELSGLTPGQTYEFKLFIRRWDTATLRAQDLTFTNGTDVQMPFSALLEDHAGIVLQNGNDESAYYLSYIYTAQGTSLKFTAATPLRAGADNGSLHMYAMSNEVSGAVVADLKITSVVRNSGGSLTLGFKGAASTAYKVTKSTDLVTFSALSTPLTFTTDGSGAATVTVPASEATTPKAFFRVEK